MTERRAARPRVPGERRRAAGPVSRKPRTRTAAALCLAAAALLSACGRKGELLPPLVRVPQAPSGLSTAQRGASIVLAWSNPEAHIDGSPLPGLSAAEVWTHEAAKPDPGVAAAPITARELEKNGALALTLTPADAADPAGFPSTCVLPLRVPSLGLTVLHVAVRVRDLRGRASEFSNPALLAPLALSLPPRAVEARLFEDRVELSWQPPDANLDGSRPARLAGYLVDRATDGEPPARLTPVPVAEPVFADRDFEMGRTYRYIVRTASAAAAPFAESDASEPVEVEARDVFAPSVPAGLLAVAGPAFVSLSWEAGREHDLQGYKVWRRAEGEPEFGLLTPAPILENAFTDAAVEKGRKYLYAVSACDTAGNESAKSAPVAAVAGETP